MDSPDNPACASDQPDAGGGEGGVDTEAEAAAAIQASRDAALACLTNGSAFPDCTCLLNPVDPSCIAATTVPYPHTWWWAPAAGFVVLVRYYCVLRAARTVPLSSSVPIAAAFLVLAYICNCGSFMLKLCIYNSD